MIKIAIADDHSFTREGLKKIIDSEIDIKCVAEAKNSESIINMVKNFDFDILILDINLPDQNGLELLKDLLNIKPDLKTIILSMHSESLYGLRSLKAGAFGYLSKDTNTNDLIKAIYKVYDGKKFVSESFAEEIAMNVSHSNNLPSHNKLTDREFEVFLCLANGYTLKNISGKLNISISTVNTYRQRVLEKLNLHSNFELTHYAIQNKLIQI